MSVLVTINITDLMPETVAKIINDQASFSQEQHQIINDLTIQNAKMEVEVAVKNQMLDLAVNYTKQSEKTMQDQRATIASMQNVVKYRDEAYRRDTVELNRRSQRITELENKLKRSAPTPMVGCRIKLTEVGRKIDAIKIVREFTGLGLKEAKEHVDLGTEFMVPDPATGKLQEALEAVGTHCEFNVGF